MVKIPPDYIRFNRNEVAGAFGDIGTDLPLLVGMIATTGMSGGAVLLMFGLLQMATGLLYGLPMPVQPLKAVAAIAITQKLSASVVYGGGIAIGAIMLLLTTTRLLNVLAAVTPKVVIRGVQFGLGLQLMSLALKEYIPRDGTPGVALAIVAFTFAFLLYQNRRFPAALPLVAIGALYAAVFLRSGAGSEVALTPVFPLSLALPAASDIWTGLLVLALPQIPLSLSNSVLATKQMVTDLFPERRLTITKIGLTYSLMNLIAPLFGGVPVCHGSGGMAGHYTFGARTGGSVMLYGSIYLIIGLLLASGFTQVLNLFPFPILGVILSFEGIALLRLFRDMTSEREWVIGLTVGLLAGIVAYGFLVGMAVGLALYYLWPYGKGDASITESAPSSEEEKDSA